MLLLGECRAPGAVCGRGTEEAPGGGPPTTYALKTSENVASYLARNLPTKVLAQSQIAVSYAVTDDQVLVLQIPRTLGPQDPLIGSKWLGKSIYNLQG